MQNRAQLKEQINLTRAIQSITQTLGDIASIKLKENRFSAEQNIRFFHEISGIYRLVKSIAIKRNIYKKPIKAKEGQTVIILLTSNQHFYGGLDQELTAFFITNTQKIKARLIVIGNMGKNILTQANYPYRFNSIIFEKDKPTPQELNNLTNDVFQYSKILVFHNQFETILSSKPTISDISASDIETLKFVPTDMYLIEPDLQKIVNLFESQIISLLFRSIFFEVDITRQASRMISMNQAGDNVDKLYATQNREMLNIKKHLLNLQLMETYAGLLKKS